MHPSFIPGFPVLVLQQHENLAQWLQKLITCFSSLKR
jgi:hypothetical protein